MGDPPFEEPSFQVRPSVVTDLCAVFSDKLIGASGAYMIEAPLPAKDSFEVPFTFVAATLT